MARKPKAIQEETGQSGQQGWEGRASNAELTGKWTIQPEKAWATPQPAHQAEEIGRLRQGGMLKFLLRKKQMCVETIE